MHLGNLLGELIFNKFSIEKKRKKFMKMTMTTMTMTTMRRLSSLLVLTVALMLLIDSWASAVPIKLHRKPGRTYKMDPIKVTTWSTVLATRFVMESVGCCRC